MNVVTRDGCDLVAGSVAMMKASLVNTDKILHDWADSLQDGAFQQLVTHAHK